MVRQNGLETRRVEGRSPTQGKGDETPNGEDGRDGRAISPKPEGTPDARGTRKGMPGSEKPGP
eukprot:11647721-Prorocentrum_lima.AAC.1